MKMTPGVRPNFFEWIGVLVVSTAFVAGLSFTTFLWLGYLFGDAMDIELRMANANLTDCRAKLAAQHEGESK